MSRVLRSASKASRSLRVTGSLGNCDTREPTLDSTAERLTELVLVWLAESAAQALTSKPAMALS
eukprot:10840879-Heterocapsa_arctica.AAC.1